jgi:hypothetical protein
MGEAVDIDCRLAAAVRATADGRGGQARRRPQRVALAAPTPAGPGT